MYTSKSIVCLNLWVVWVSGIAEQEEPHLKRKVLRLSQSLNQIKDVNLQLIASTSKELVEDPLKSVEQSKRWKIKSSYGDIGLKYRDEETIAYVASRMPAVYSACYRVLSEVEMNEICNYDFLSKFWILGVNLQFWLVAEKLWEQRSFLKWKGGWNMCCVCIKINWVEVLVSSDLNSWNCSCKC